MPIASLDRRVIALSGEDDPREFLSGLITNSLSGLISFAALLTPQGKIIADFFVIDEGERLLIDVAEKFAPYLIKRLKMYKLRSKLDISDTGINVYAAWDGEGDEGFADPRDTRLGRRIYTPALESTASADDYNTHRLGLGIPDSIWDFETAQVFPADANMDLLNGVNYKKGCFVGQEVVSRMHRKTSVRKRMRALTGPRGGAPFDTLWQGETRVGEHLSHFGNAGMAIIRMDKVDAAAPITDTSGGSFTLGDWPYGD